MPNLYSINKKAALIKSYIFLFVGFIFELLLILLTLLPGGKFNASPLLFSLVQVFPIIFIESSIRDLNILYRIRKENISVDNTVIIKDIAKPIAIFGLANTIFGGIIVLILLITSPILLIISSSSLTLTVYTYYFAGTLAVYVIIIRNIIAYLLKKSRLGDKINPITVILMLLSSFSLIGGGSLIYYGLKNDNPQNSLQIGSILIVMAIVMFLFKNVAKPANYKIEGGNLYLYFPNFNNGKTPFIIPVTNITQAQKINVDEARSLLFNYKVQFQKSIEDEIQWIRYAFQGKYPYYYTNLFNMLFQENINNPNVVLIRGQEFIYIIELQNSDDFIKNISQFLNKKQ